MISVVVKTFSEFRETARRLLAGDVSADRVTWGQESLLQRVFRKNIST
jgi:hypothetical protein